MNNKGVDPDVHENDMVENIRKAIIDENSGFDIQEIVRALEINGDLLRKTNARRKWSVDLDRMKGMCPAKCS